MKKGLITALSWGMITFGLLSVASSQANDQYNQGADYARDIQGQGTHALKDFKPGEVLPNYTESPAEKNYYGGVTTPNTNLDSQGSQALVNSDAGKAITESILNNPKEPLSMDAPFISVGTEAQEKAEQVTDGSFDGCVEQNVTNTEFTSHICAKDTKVEQVCTRTASISGNYSDVFNTQAESFIVSNSSYTNSGGNYIIVFTPTLSGEILSATVSKAASRFPVDVPYTVLGTTIYLNQSVNYSNYPFSPAIKSIKAGESFTLIHPTAVGNVSMGKPSAVTITLTIKVTNKVFNPYITWSESCPFDKAEGGLTKTECSEPGGNKTVYVDGKPYTLYSACWAYKDTYLTQSESDGTCGEYVKNPSCTIATRQCAYSLDGFCMRENLTYSCESKTSGSGMMCGGQFFCTDGSCALAASGTNNMFAHAVSQLAAVAAAGKDVADMNDINVKAFTGRGQSCKKFAVGFNNCCKDSGWGADLGLASCSSEEKALGQAKERKLTVDIGEYCSKKVLGICLEKKRSYCVFDSKLAQIIQQQGRQWQLGIGFGAAESPNCRGITVEELQSIQFDRVDFSNFKDDLNSGTAVPGDNDLLDRVKQQIEDQLNKNTGGK